MGSARAGGIAMMVFAAGLVAWFAAEFGTGTTDGDNPELSLAFIADHPSVYVFAGVALLVMALTLTVATLAVGDLADDEPPSLSRRSISTLGRFSAAFFFLQGVSRINAPGTLGYIESLDHDWGISAYLAVQMAGMQGFAAAGLLALFVWAAGISLLDLRRKAFPVAVRLLGLFPAVIAVLSVLGPLDALPDWFYAVYVSSLFGAMAWCLTLGVVLLRLEPRAPSPSDGT